MHHRPYLALLALLGRLARLARTAPLALCLLLDAAGAGAAELVDQAGRTVTLPASVQRIYGSSPPFMVLLSTLAPQRNLGLNFALPAEAARYGPAGLTMLPVLGGVSGHGQLVNPETLMALKPDLVLGWKSRFSDHGETAALAERTGAPLLFVKLDTLADWPGAYALVGRAIGEEARAAQLGGYIQAALARVQQAVAEVPAEHRVRVYYAEQPDGLATECDSSFHAEAIALAGGINVHRCPQNGIAGMERLNLEQVLAYDPQVIVAQDPGFAAHVGADPRWAGVRAVREHRVLWVPRLPFNWLDRPPSATRALGIQWLAGAFYPRRAPFDAAQEVPAFYRLFYGVELTPTDVQTLMAVPDGTSAMAAGTPQHKHPDVGVGHAMPGSAP
ncbi:ABC transporter substrate-binding protein [Variovorax ginsengisoli]|nr:ABC transporter substrate-binding protein [Variovorax ginsengisoli]